MGVVDIDVDVGGVVVVVAVVVVVVLGNEEKNTAPAKIDTVSITAIVTGIKMVLENPESYSLITNPPALWTPTLEIY